MCLDFQNFCGALLVLNIGNPALEPARIGVICIDAIVDSDLFARLPLREDSVGPDVDVLVISAGPAGVVDVDLEALGVDDLAVDPFFLCVPHVHILSQVVLQFFPLALHAL